MIRLLRRHADDTEQHAALFRSIAADLAVERTEQARQRQEAAWVTYTPNILHPAFVGSAVAR